MSTQNIILFSWNHNNTDIVIRDVLSLSKSEIIQFYNIAGKNSNIIEYILKRIDRTYESINNFVENVDKLSLEKKRELTIPLIKELL